MCIHYLLHLVARTLDLRRVTARKQDRLSYIFVADESVTLHLLNSVSLFFW